MARRVLELIGMGDDDRFWSFAGRVAHRDELDERMASWVGARTMDEVLAAFEAAHAAAAPVFSMADIAADPHYAARRSIIEVDGIPMQNLVAHLSRTPGALRCSGRALGADGPQIRAELFDSDGASQQLVQQRPTRGAPAERGSQGALPPGASESTKS